MRILAAASKSIKIAGKNTVTAIIGFPSASVRGTIIAGGDLKFAYSKTLGAIGIGPRAICRGIKIVALDIRFAILKTLRGIQLANWAILCLVARPLVGLGLGRLFFIRWLYKQITSILVPEHVTIVDTGLYKIRAVVSRKRPIDGVSQHLIMCKVYEPQVARVLKHIIKEGMTVVDIGANIGCHTMLAAQLVGKKGKVYAFEPEPSNFQELQENIKLNKFTNVEAIQKAVSEGNGTAELFLSRVESGSHSLVYRNPDVRKILKVDMVSLDSVINSHKVDLIKTDTEGNDMLVLLGAKNTIANSPDIKLIIEFWLKGLTVCGYSAMDFWQLLEDYGFGFIYLLTDKKDEIIPVALHDVLKYCKKQVVSPNLLCSKTPIRMKKL